MRSYKPKGLMMKYIAPLVIGAASLIGCGSDDGGDDNNPPVAINDVSSVVEDTFNNEIDVLANDSDVEDGVPILNSVTDPANGTAVINGDKVGYTPDADFDGVDNFNYTVKDSKGATDTGSVTVNVSNVNDAPVINSSPLENIVVGSAYSYDVNATDVDGDILVYDVMGPSGMNINSSTGFITWNANELGEHMISVEIDDGTTQVYQNFNLLVRSVHEDLSDKVKGVIITDSGMSGDFQTLADWKTQKGVPTIVELMSNISGSYGGRDDAEDLRNYIKNLAISNPELDYVLLGGDIEVVPYREVTASCSIPLTDTKMPCDLYFSDLDGDWDQDGDSIFGETTDNVEMHPDVFVGRAPVNDSTEANVFVNKVINYEQGLNDLSNVKDVLFMAEKLSPTNDSAIRKDLINGTTFGWQVDFTGKGFNLIRLYETQYNGAGLEDKVSVMAALNAGPHIVNIYGHGGETGLGVGSGLNYIYCDDTDPTADIRDLTNLTKPFIFYSLGCHSGAFDNVYLAPGDDCILEELIENPNGGAVACIGGSRVGLYNTSSTDGRGVSWDYDVEFYNSLFNKGIKNIGKTLADSKEVYADVSKTNDDRRWMQYCLNLLGDPEMPIWTDYLGDVNATVTGINHKEVDVDDGTNPIVGASVIVKQGPIIYKALTDSNGKAVFNVSGAVDSVTATMDNYKPWKSN